MSNNKNDKKMKELLARFCLDNQVQPYSISEKDFKNAEIKDGDTWKKINADEQINIENADLKLRVKNSKSEMEEIIAQKAQRFDLEGNNLQDINILAKDNNGKSIMCSTFDFIDVYERLYEKGLELSDKLDRIEDAAKLVGKPVVYISHAQVFDQTGTAIHPTEVIPYEEIDIDGPMTNRAGQEICDHVEDEVIFDGMTEEVAGYQVTVLVALDAIYVHIDEDRELVLEKIMESSLSKGGGGNGDLLLMITKEYGELELPPEREGDLEPGWLEH